MASNVIAATPPASQRVRAFFAPVNRTASAPTIFDAANIAAFDVNAPPAPWLDLGWCSSFTRKSGTKTIALIAGAPGVAIAQARTEIEASVSLQFDAWGKLQLALTAGVQQMNLLATQPNAAPNGSGGAAIAAVPLNSGSTASELDVGASAAAGFSAGDIVAVDLDYTGQLGFVGSGVSGGYVKSAAPDIDYIRRITLNVARIASIAAGVLTLGAPLLAGVPTAGMQVSKVIGFCDREGGSFFQEWSALFALEGAQGDRVLFHYPRLQATTGATEAVTPLGKGGLEQTRLAGIFRALPVKDANDGESIVCFRSYLPAAMRTV